MSLRIQNDPAPELNPAPAARTNQASYSDKTAAFFQNTNKNSGPDKVEISSVTESLTSAVQGQSLAQAQRVRQLTALYQAGRYTVDAAQVSKALIGDAGGSPAGDI